MAMFLHGGIGDLPRQSIALSPIQKTAQPLIVERKLSY